MNSTMSSGSRTAICVVIRGWYRFGMQSAIATYSHRPGGGSRRLGGCSFAPRSAALSSPAVDVGEVLDRRKLDRRELDPREYGVGHADPRPLGSAACRAAQYPPSSK